MSAWVECFLQEQIFDANIFFTVYLQDLFYATKNMLKPARHLYNHHYHTWEI
jgi:hypothetical protein